VLDDEVGWVVAVELSGVVDVSSPGVAVDPVVEDEVPVGIGVSVGVVEDPPVVVEPLLSEGAIGLTPPLPGAVEMPPLARSLILTGVVVVTEGEFDADPSGLVVDALAESPLATPAGAWVRAISGDDGTVAAASLDSARGVVMRAGAAGAAGATLTVRVWWCCTGAGSVC